MTLNIKNTARDWRSFLVELAAEAARDADSTPTEYALHDVLHDLSLVAAAYSERLDVLRGEEGDTEGEEELKRLVPDGANQLVTDAPPAAQAGPVSPSELPDWLLETLRTMGAEIEDLKARVAELELNAQKTTITPAPQYALDEIGIFDEDRSAWNSVGRARSALRGMIGREHQQRARIRQAILARVTALAIQQHDLNADERAELAQHRDRADELATIDAIAGTKIDEIEGIDDLLALREYDTRAGWPQ